jgi:selenide,water dikinase
MLNASGVDARLDPQAIPALDGALALLAGGLTSSLDGANRAALAALGPAAPDTPLAALLVDPQTAGGLLAGIPPERAQSCLDELSRLGYRAALIGIAAARDGATPRVSLDPGCARQSSVPLSAAAG